MTQKELYQLLQPLGLPMAYHHFVGAKLPPYIVYLETDAEAWGADESNGIKRTAYLVELYTVQKDLATQARLEALFDKKGIQYGCAETYIDTEKLYQAAYHIEFVSKIRR